MRRKDHLKPALLLRKGNSQKFLGKSKKTSQLYEGTEVFLLKPVSRSDRPKKRHNSRHKRAGKSHSKCSDGRPLSEIRIPVVKEESEEDVPNESSQKVPHALDGDSPSKSRVGVEDHIPKTIFRDALIG